MAMFSFAHSLCSLRKTGVFAICALAIAVSLCFLAPLCEGDLGSSVAFAAQEKDPGRKTETIGTITTMVFLHLDGSRSITAEFGIITILSTVECRLAGWFGAAVGFTWRILMGRA